MSNIDRNEETKCLEASESSVDGPGPSSLRSLVDRGIIGREPSAAFEASSSGTFPPGSGAFDVFVEAGLLSNIEASLDLTPPTSQPMATRSG